MRSYLISVLAVSVHVLLLGAQWLRCSKEDYKTIPISKPGNPVASWLKCATKMLPHAIHKLSYSLSFAGEENGFGVMLGRTRGTQCVLAVKDITKYTIK